MYARGDVFRSVDPFKLGADAERYWLVLNDDRHPFADEQFIAVTLTTTPREPAVPLAAGAWVEGSLPAESFVLPWALHSPRIEDITERVGRLSEAFVRTVLDEVRAYLEPR